MRWMAERRFIVFVHSDSPVWKEHLNERLFPLINDATVFLNWSHRKQWKLKTPLEAKMLWHWGGPREFNPMAIIVPPKGRVHVIRFYKAFRDMKHGKPARLERAERELLDRLSDIRRSFIGSFTL